MAEILLIEHLGRKILKYQSHSAYSVQRNPLLPLCFASTIKPSSGLYTYSVWCVCVQLAASRKRLFLVHTMQLCRNNKVRMDLAGERSAMNLRVYFSPSHSVFALSSSSRQSKTNHHIKKFISRINRVPFMDLSLGV